MSPRAEREVVSPDGLEARAERYVRANFRRGGRALLRLWLALEHAKTNRQEAEPWQDVANKLAAAIASGS